MQRSRASTRQAGVAAGKKATMRVHARPLATVWQRPRQTALQIDRTARPARTRRRFADKGPAGKCAPGDGFGLVPRGYRRAACEVSELLLHQFLQRRRARSDVEPRLPAPAFPEQQRRYRQPNDAEPGGLVEDGGLARAVHPSSPGCQPPPSGSTSYIRRLMHTSRRISDIVTILRQLAHVSKASTGHRSFSVT